MVDEMVSPSMGMSLSKLWKMVKVEKPVLCSQWGYKKSDTIERLNKNKVFFVYLLTPSDLRLSLKLITTFVPTLKKIS